MRFKKTVGCIVIGTVLCSSFAVFAEYDPNKIPTNGQVITTTNIEYKPTIDKFYKNQAPFLVVVDGKLLNAEESSAYIKDEDMVLVPLRAVSESLGYDIQWNGEQSAVELSKGAHWTKLKIGEDSYQFAKMAPMSLGAAPELIEGQTYVPLNFLTDILKVDVVQESTGVIRVSSENDSQEEKQSLLNIEGIIKQINKDKDTTMIWVETSGKTDSVVLKTNEDTVLVNPLTDEALSLDDLKEGDRIRGFYGPVMTRSLPPQANAEKIELLEQVTVKIGTITQINNDGNIKQVMIGNREKGIRLNISDDTIIVSEDNKTLAFDDLTEGMEIEVFHNLIMTMSLPPISTAQKIVVK